jgi:hypothetical protein
MTIDDPNAKVRNTDPLTSRDAAGKQTKAKSDVIRDHLLSFLRMYGPMTDDELAKEYRTGRERAESIYPAASPSGLRSRRSELRAAGLVVATDQRKPSDLGSPSTVWAAVPDAQG